MMIRIFRLKRTGGYLATTFASPGRLPPLNEQRRTSLVADVLKGYDSRKIDPADVEVLELADNEDPRNAGNTIAPDAVVVEPELRERLDTLISRVEAASNLNQLKPLIVELIREFGPY